jgi:phosphoglycolate phosphatase
VKVSGEYGGHVNDTSSHPQFLTSSPSYLTSSPSKFRLIVFDLDGTLVDSRRDLAESANQLLEQCGGSPLAEEAIGRMVGDGAATLVARVFVAANLAQPADALSRFLTFYNGRLLRFTRPYVGIPELLTSAQKRTTLAVLTNKPLAATRAILDGLELSRYFGDRVVGGDGPFPRKPSPESLMHLIASIGASPATTLLVGDSVIDWRTAHAAGAFSCVARYGFGFDGFPTDALSPDDRLIDHPAELLPLL